MLQRLLGQEIDRQEELLLRAEDMNDRLFDHLHPTEDASAEDESEEDIALRVRRQDYPLAVTIPDSERICLRKGSWTLRKVIDELDVEKVMALNIMSHTIPLVHVRRLRRAQQTKLGRYYIASNTSTADKVEQLEEIKRRLNIQLEIEQLNVEYEET